MDETHFLELIHDIKQQELSFELVSKWYEKHYGPDAIRYIHSILSIWTHYMEKHQLISMKEVIDQLDPRHWYYPAFVDLSQPQNEKFPYRVLAILLSKLRLTPYKQIPGFAEQYGLK